MLLTDKAFQKVLCDWAGFSDVEKAKVCSDFNVSEKEIGVLNILWSGLNFRLFEQPESVIEEALHETIWKLAEKSDEPFRKPVIRILYERFARIAAILIIPIILFTAYILFIHDNEVVPGTVSRMVTVTSQSGTITNLVLPDGSKVYLNSGSSISYPDHFSGDSRDVILTGEGYFNVIKDKKLPMVVSAGNLYVKVYGTSFNVNAFPSEESVKVTLEEGSISLSSDAGKFNGQDEFFIEPGQTVTYSENSKSLTVQNDDTYLYTSWKDGILMFRDTPFESVLKQLSRRFNVQIELKDTSLAPIHMNATFRDENINEILRLLSISTGFKYYYAPTQKLTDGSFEKSKIIIEKE